LEQAYFFHILVLLMPFRPIKRLSMLMLQNCCAVMASDGNFDSLPFT
jgi:hypothetical protein